MHAGMRDRPSAIRPWLDRIGVPALVSAVVVVVLLATAVWLDILHVGPVPQASDATLVDLDKPALANSAGKPEDAASSSAGRETSYSSTANEPSAIARAAIASAYEKLLSVESAHVVKEHSTNRLGGALAASSHASLVTLEDDWASSVEELIEEANCVEEGTYRACDLVDKKTGQVKGSMWFSGGSSITEGDFVPPDKWHFTRSHAFDRVGLVGTGIVGTREEEGLHANARLYTKQSGFWHEVRNCCEDKPLFWHLFDQVESSAYVVADTAVDGTPAVHYRTEYINTDGGSTVKEWWVAKENGLPLIVVLDHEVEGLHEVRTVYRFSDFNKPVSMPDPTS